MNDWMQGKTLIVYVPRPGTGMDRIAPKSGIVGSPFHRTPQGRASPTQEEWLLGSEGKIRIHYEGNIYGAVNIRTFADRVRQAAGRHIMNYPTIAFAVVPESGLIPVGIFDGDRVMVDREGVGYAALAAWLHVAVIEPSELQVTS
jgi:hypothetical protein